MMEATNGATKPAESTLSAPTQNGDAAAEKEGAAHYALPDAGTLKEVGELLIKDENGKEMQFKSLYEDPSGRQLIVFIRHFYCGHCEEFIRFLAAHLPPSALASTTPPTSLTIIGCGDPSCIPDYRTRTMPHLGYDAWPIYTDRDRAIYIKLGMVINLKQSDEGKPEYINGSILGNVASSMKNIFTAGPKGFKGGKYDQNGGEWVFEDGKCVWGRRMRNTQDHATLEELKSVLGVQ